MQVPLPCSSDYSMPSDHTIIAGAFVAGLLILSWRLPALLLAVLLAFSRVYVGVHYPADTILGLLAGAIIGVAIVLGLRRPATPLARRLTETPLRILVTAPRRNRRGRVRARRGHRTGPTLRRACP